MKTCPCCKEIKPKTEFSTNKSKKDGVQSHCKLCRNQYKKQYTIDNPRYFADKSIVYRKLNIDKIKETRAQSYVINRIAILERNRKWAESNPDKVRSSNKKWYQNNIERKLASCHKRRALILKSKGTYVVGDIETMMIKQGNKCVYCHIDLSMNNRNSYHIDHILPLVLGGSNFPTNLQLLCPKCNVAKGAKHPDEYERVIGCNRVSNANVSLLKEKPVSEL